MTEQRMKTLNDLIVELDKNPEHRKQNRLQKPFYDLTLEILHRRKQLGITQKELAERMGRHQSAISRIEAAENDTRLSTLAEIAEALECWVEIKLVPNMHLNDEDLQSLKVFGQSSSSQEYRRSSAKQKPVEFSV